MFSAGEIPEDQTDKVELNDNQDEDDEGADNQNDQMEENENDMTDENSKQIYLGIVCLFRSCAILALCSSERNCAQAALLVTTWQ